MIDPDTRRAFGTLVLAAFADGRLTEDERLVLHRKATEMKVPIRDMNEIIEQGQQGRLSVSVPGTTREREALLDSLIDVVCADGRIEPPEHHLLAKFAGHLKLSLPDLRQRVKDRMDRKTTRTGARPLPAPASASAAATSPQAPPSLASAPASGPLIPHGPVLLDHPKLVDPKIEGIPPVTLHLIKQAIVFENDADAAGYIERTLGVSKDEARRIFAEVLAAFPGLQRNAPPRQGR